MISVGIFVGGERIELFDDEKISVTSSIQNINDISKVFTDYSQTFTVPASVKNNRIFKHWYENSLDDQFSTLTKVDAYIELDTILFRRGKIQLESCNIVDGHPQNYSITFLGSLASLKDKFAGLFLKNLDSDYYDITYTPTIVKDKVTTTAVSDDVMFPLISSDRYWTYGSGGAHDVNINSHPIRYNELFPAIRLSAIFDMIQRDSKWDINFNGSFLTDARFTNAYLWLKNAEKFEAKPKQTLITWDSVDAVFGWIVDLANDSFRYDEFTPFITLKASIVMLIVEVGVPYNIHIYKNGVESGNIKSTSTGSYQNITFAGNDLVSGDNISIKISSTVVVNFSATLDLVVNEDDGEGGTTSISTTVNKSLQTYSNNTLPINQYFPEIKIEDFFAGILKMFNLTCFSEDGINFTVEQLESYYNSGAVRDITKYIKSDNIDLNRVKSYKKINFEYEKSESLVNVGFFSNNGVEYGSLLYSTNNEGEEYSIKLPFEDLNFSNLQDKLQVGYALKSDLQKYIPKPIILYDYNPTALTTLTDTTYHFATALTGNGTGYTSYKAFGQEFYDGTDYFSLNFNSQQSTITNEIVTKSLYNQYYEKYFANIFSFKARIYKAVAIFPISLLTSLKLNDRLIIRDKKFIINTMPIDLTTGEVQLELLTDFRQ